MGKREGSSERREKRKREQRENRTNIRKKLQKK